LDELGEPERLEEPLRLPLRDERELDACRLDSRVGSPSGGGASWLLDPDEFDRLLVRPLVGRLADLVLVALERPARVDGSALAGGADFERRLPLVDGRRSGTAARRCGVSQ
jgi:hypothetical protein